MLNLSSLTLGVHARLIAKRSLSCCVKNHQKSNDVPTTPELHPCEFEPEPYSGPSYEEVLSIRSKNITPSKRAMYSKPMLLNQGKMQWLWDHEGNRYLDFFGGICTVGVGHCHPRVVESFTKQANKLWHTSNVFMHPNLHTYAEKLTATLPDKLKVCFFTNSGSEANDIAMVMARLHTGAFDIISLRNSYHGASPYTVGLTAHGTWKHNYANGFGIHHVMNPDPYRGLWGGANCRDSLVQTDRSCACAEGQCEAGDNYLAQLEETLKHSCAPKIAAMFIEGIQGVGGTVQFPKNYVKGAYEMIRERGGVCISDEVQSGFGRLGSHMWAFQTHDVVPDIVIMAKSIGNGVAMGAVVTTQELADSFARNVLHLNTYAGNPLATSAASAVLDVIEDEKLMENCTNVGGRMLKKLEKLRDEFSCVGDVRGKGLMIGVEMVTDKETRAPLPGDIMARMHDRTREMGLIIGRGSLAGNTFRIKPPMMVNDQDVDFAVAVMRKAIYEYEQTK